MQNKSWVMNEWAIRILCKREEWGGEREEKKVDEIETRGNLARLLSSPAAESVLITSAAAAPSSPPPTGPCWPPCSTRTPICSTSSSVGSVPSGVPPSSMDHYSPDGIAVLSLRLPPPPDLPPPNWTSSSPASFRILTLQLLLSSACSSLPDHSSSSPSSSSHSLHPSLSTGIPSPNPHIGRSKSHEHVTIRR